MGRSQAPNQFNSGNHVCGFGSQYSKPGSSFRVAAYHGTKSENETMKIQDCRSGQAVVQKESGKNATIRRIYGSSGEVELSFENGTTARIHVRLIEPSSEAADAEVDSGPQRPCPQCAAKMPVTATICPACGFAYGVKTPAPSRNWALILPFVVLVGAAAYAVWKYALAGKGP